MGQTQNKVNQAMEHNSRVVVEHDFNPCTGKAETGGSQEFQGQHGLQELVPGQTPKPQKNPVPPKKCNTRKTRAISRILWTMSKVALGPQLTVMGRVGFSGSEEPLQKGTGSRSLPSLPNILPVSMKEFHFILRNSGP